jgi:NAD(P)-dependent dehydrogenase (short-subunit alcohol dehydrogenase family)
MTSPSEAGATLTGQCAIVTGASGSLGYAAARRLAQAGATVVLADIAGQNEAAEKLAQFGLKVCPHEVDVTDERSIQHLIESVMEKFGRIDILVNSAAIASLLKPAPFEAISAEQWHRLYDVNVVGLARMSAAVSPHMRKAKSGRIINLTSGVAYKAPPGIMHYVATKGAVISVTRSLASELAPDNILVNAVSPGFTPPDEGVLPPELVERFSAIAIANRLIKRHAEPADVANVIHFLASADAAFVTGQVIVADGGSVFN